MELKKEEICSQEAKLKTQDAKKIVKISQAFVNSHASHATKQAFKLKWKLNLHSAKFPRHTSNGRILQESTYTLKETCGVFGWKYVHTKITIFNVNKISVDIDVKWFAKNNSLWCWPSQEKSFKWRLIAGSINCILFAMAEEHIFNISTLEIKVFRIAIESETPIEKTRSQSLSSGHSFAISEHLMADYCNVMLKPQQQLLVRQKLNNSHGRRHTWTRSKTKTKQTQCNGNSSNHSPIPSNC